MEYNAKQFADLRPIHRHPNRRMARTQYGDQPDDNEPLAKTVRYDQCLKRSPRGLTKVGGWCFPSKICGAEDATFNIENAQ